MDLPDKAAMLCLRKGKTKIPTKSLLSLINLDSPINPPCEPEAGEVSNCSAKQ